MRRIGEQWPADMIRGIWAKHLSEHELSQCLEDHSAQCIVAVVDTIKTRVLTFCIEIERAGAGKMPRMKYELRRKGWPRSSTLIFGQCSKYGNGQ